MVYGRGMDVKERRAEEGAVDECGSAKEEEFGRSLMLRLGVGALVIARLPGRKLRSFAEVVAATRVSCHASGRGLVALLAITVFSCKQRNVGGICSR